MTSKQLSTREESSIVEAKQISFDTGEVMRQLGQYQAFDFTKKMSQVAVIKLAQQMRAEKAYKAVVYRDEHGQLQTCGTWDVFCRQFIGKAGDNVTRDIELLKTFGEEFLEANQKIGLGYRDLRQLHKMDPNDRQLLIEQTLEQDLGKEQVKEMIDDLVDQQTLELSKAHKERDDAKADLEAARENSAEKNQQIDELKEQLHANRFKRDAWAQATAEVIEQLGVLRVEAGQIFEGLHGIHEKLLDENIEFTGPGLTLAMQEFCATTRHLGDLAGNLFAVMKRDCAGYEEVNRPGPEVLDEIGINDDVLFFNPDDVAHGQVIDAVVEP